MKHKHGFERPFHNLQITSWIFFLIFALSFWCFFTIALPDTYLIIFNALYLIEVIVVVTSTAKATNTDPRDPNSLDENSLEEAEKLRCKPCPDNQTWCPYCGFYVHYRSKHCRICDKCILVFDHHCKWLNNCVGCKNYRYFLTCIVSVLVLLATQLAVGTYVFVLCFLSPRTVLDNLQLRYSQFSFIIYKVVIGVFITLVLPLAFSIGELVVLHVTLISRNKTTYDWILERRAKMKEEQKTAKKARIRPEPTPKPPRHKGITPGHNAWTSNSTQQCNNC